MLSVVPGCAPAQNEALRCFTLNLLLWFCAVSWEDWSVRINFRRILISDFSLNPPLKLLSSLNLWTLYCNSCNHTETILIPGLLFCMNGWFFSGNPPAVSISLYAAVQKLFHWLHRWVIHLSKLIEKPPITKADPLVKVIVRSNKYHYHLQLEHTRYPPVWQFKSTLRATSVGGFVLNNSFYKRTLIKGIGSKFSEVFIMYKVAGKLLRPELSSAKIR